VSTQEKLHLKIHELLSYRLARAMEIEPGVFQCLSIADQVAIIFLLEGDGQATGFSGDTVHALLALLGKPLFWKVPESGENKGTIQ
jgi:hypothetical protein